MNRRQPVLDKISSQNLLKLKSKVGSWLLHKIKVSLFAEGGYKHLYWQLDNSIEFIFCNATILFWGSLYESHYNQ